MPQLHFTFLDHRSAVSISGADAESFLQGLVSNDVEKASESHAIWAAFLTPQGKFLHEFMIAKQDGHFLLECERNRRDDLITRLRRYRLRAKADIEPEDEYRVAAVWGDNVAPALDLKNEPGFATSQGSSILFLDPRHADMGARIIGPEKDIEAILETAGCDQANIADYDEIRAALGVPDGSRDMEVEKALLLENGFEELKGIDFEKGCYVGQELTARTHYRALIKKRLLPVAIDGPAPAPGMQLTVDGKEAGEMKSSSQAHGLALVRLAEWQKATDGVLLAGETRLTPKPAPWMVLPASGAGAS